MAARKASGGRYNCKAGDERSRRSSERKHTHNSHNKNVETLSFSLALLFLCRAHRTVQVVRKYGRLMCARVFSLAGPSGPCLARCCHACEEQAVSNGGGDAGGPRRAEG